jgi:hypothetical protein
MSRARESERERERERGGGGEGQMGIDCENDYGVLEAVNKTLSKLNAEKYFSPHMLTLSRC